MLLSVELSLTANWFAVKSGKFKDITSVEKQIIATNLKRGMTTLQMSKMLKRK